MPSLISYVNLSLSALSSSSQQINYLALAPSQRFDVAAREQPIARIYAPWWPRNLCPIRTTSARDYAQIDNGGCRSSAQITIAAAYGFSLNVVAVPQIDGGD